MHERSRVLHMGPDPELGGGMAASLRSLLESPLAASYELEVDPTYRGAAPLLRIAVFCLALIRLTLWSLRGRGRIVHVHATVRGSMYRKAVCVLLAKGLRRRVVLHVHSGPGDIATFRDGRDAFSVALFRAAFAAADAVLAVSRSSAEALAHAYSVPVPEVVPNAAPPVRAVERPAPGADPLRVVYLGGFANPVKGGDVALEAFRAVLRREPEVQIAMAGPGQLPALGRELVAAHPSLSWEGWLERDRLEQVLVSSHVFVLPSRSEGSPMALLEAMSFGLAIVATGVGGIPDLLDDGTQGLLVAVESPEALAGALARLATDRELVARLGAAAQARAGEYDVVEIAGRLAAIYSRLA